MLTNTDTPPQFGCVVGNSDRAKDIGRTLELLLKFPVICELTDCKQSKLPQNGQIEILFMPYIGTNQRQFINTIDPKRIKTIAVYDVPDDMQASQMLKQGFDGVFYFDEPLDAIARGIRMMLEGELWYKRHLISQYIVQNEHLRRKAESASQFPQLQANFSRRELEVLALLAQGVKNIDISDALFISKHTVKSHVSRIFKKLEVNTRAEAAAWAINHQFILTNYAL